MKYKIPVQRMVDSRSGGVALMLLVILGMVAVISGATILFVNRQYNQTVRQEQEEKSFHIAEAGVNYVVFGLNESIHTTEGLINAGEIIGAVYGQDGEVAGRYTLTLTQSPGSQPGQEVSLVSKGRDSEGRYCQAIEVVIHRTDDAREQFVVDKWNHLPACTDLPGSSTAPPGGSGTPSGSVSPSVSPSGSESPSPSPSDSGPECSVGTDCASGVCYATGECADTCSADSECSTGVCQESTGICGSTCNDDSDCSSSTGSSASIGGKCNVTSGTCDPPPPPDGPGCSGASDCPGGQACTGGACVVPIIPDIGPAGGSCPELGCIPQRVAGPCNGCTQSVAYSGGVDCENDGIREGDPNVRPPYLPECPYTEVCSTIDAPICAAMWVTEICGECIPTPTPTPSTCGDGICNFLEGPITCPTDCSPSATPSSTSSFCGDLICDAGEDTSCPSDCSSSSTPTPSSSSFCGDLICDAGEDTSCPSDCSPSTTPTSS